MSRLIISMIPYHYFYVPINLEKHKINIFLKSIFILDLVDFASHIRFCFQDSQNLIIKRVIKATFIF